MKKAYSTPEIEKINFQYRDQVVAASSRCDPIYNNVDTDGNKICDSETPTFGGYNQ